MRIQDFAKGVLQVQRPKVNHVVNLSCTSRAICSQSSGPAWGTVLEIVNMIPGYIF